MLSHRKYTIGCGHTICTRHNFLRMAMMSKSTSSTLVNKVILFPFPLYALHFLIMVSFLPRDCKQQYILPERLFRNVRYDHHVFDHKWPEHISGYLSSYEHRVKRLCMSWREAIQSKQEHLTYPIIRRDELSGQKQHSQRIKTRSILSPSNDFKPM